jgi:L-alanine-DL-glutamate epimerase-like enolase superfamily enzyme
MAGDEITAVIQVPLKPGLGIELDLDMISRFRVET